MKNALGTAWLIARVLFVPVCVLLIGMAYLWFFLVFIQGATEARKERLDLRQREVAALEEIARQGKSPTPPAAEEKRNAH